MLFQGADRNAQSTPSCLIHQDSGHRQGADAARVGQQNTDDHREPDRDHLHRGGARLGVLGLFRRAQAADQAGKALIMQHTEVLVEEALKRKKEGMKVLDLCTGSGCILLSILKNLKQGTGVGIDISEQALEVARRNAKRLGLVTR